jgi:probable rRNA maturation factor
MQRPIDIRIDHPTLHCKATAIKTMIRAAMVEIGSGFPDGDLSVAFLTDKHLASLHHTFLEDPTPTDVITFPGDPLMDFAGEVCVSVDRALAVCSENGQTFQEELTLYLVHGLLHLAGWDDRSPGDRVEMREGESRVMQALREAGVVPLFTLKLPKKSRPPME